MEIFAGAQEDGDKTGITAIVIDDDIDTVSVLSEFLKIKGINVIGKGYDGKQAIKMYKKLEPDVVFLDVLMKNHDGFYALEKIKEIQSDAIVILITADVTEETKKRVLELNASAIIYKPYDIDEVMHETDKLVLKLKQELLEDIAVKQARLEELNAILNNRMSKSKMDIVYRSQYLDEKEKLI
jgi:two-component system, chemotaxis family, chemotaxis protein CheY